MGLHDVDANLACKKITSVAFQKITKLPAKPPFSSFFYSFLPIFCTKTVGAFEPTKSSRSLKSLVSISPATNKICNQPSRGTYEQTLSFRGCFFFFFSGFFLLFCLFVFFFWLFGVLLVFFLFLFLFFSS